MLPGHEGEPIAFASPRQGSLKWSRQCIPMIQDRATHHRRDSRHRWNLIQHHASVAVGTTVSDEPRAQLRKRPSRPVLRADPHAAE